MESMQMSVTDIHVIKEPHCITTTLMHNNNNNNNDRLTAFDPGQPG